MENAGLPIAGAPFANDVPYAAGKDATEEDSNAKEKDLRIPPDSQYEAPEVQPRTDEIPDGGLTAWLTVLGCSLAFFATLGSVASFGVFQSQYEAVLPSKSSGAISWITAIQSASVTALAVPSVLFSAHVGPHKALATGTFFIVFGVMMASISSQYYQYLLSHGICVGIGVGICFMPTIALPNQWFQKRRGTAVGIVVSGSSLGGVAWPIVVNKMINGEGVDFRWVLRTLGFCQLALMLAAMALVRSNVSRRAAIGIRDFRRPFLLAIKDRATLTYTVGQFLQMLTLYTPYYFSSVYCQALGASPSMAFWSVSVINASTFFGRIILGKVSDKIGHNNTLVLAVFTSGLLTFCWLAVRTVTAMFIWITFYGFFSGASVSLQTPAIVQLVPNVPGRVTLMGPYIAIVSQTTSIGALVGPFLAGKLLSDRSESSATAIPDDYHPMMYLSGAGLFASSILFAVCYKVRRTGT